MSKRLLSAEGDPVRLACGYPEGEKRELTVRGVGVPEHDAAKRVVLALRVGDVLSEGRWGHVALVRRVGGCRRADVHLNVGVRRLGLRPLVPRGEVELRLVVQAAVVVVCRRTRSARKDVWQGGRRTELDVDGVKVSLVQRSTDVGVGVGALGRGGDVVLPARQRTIRVSLYMQTEGGTRRTCSCS